MKKIYKSIFFILIKSCAFCSHGNAYSESFLKAIEAREWPDQYPGSDCPGIGYHESQWAAEDADCID